MSEKKTPENGDEDGAAVLKNCISCACSGGAGVLLGHLGCLLTPLMFAALGFTGVAASSPLTAVGVGAAVTAGGLGAWYGLRGRFAGATERKIVVAGAIAGFAAMAAFNLAAGHTHDAGTYLFLDSICRGTLKP